MASKTQRNRGRFYPVPIDDYGRICVTFEIPNHTFYKAAVRGVLHDLEAASSWHYTHNPGDSNASKVAQLFRQLLFETYRYSAAPCRTDCPDCPEPEPCPECEDCEDFIEDEIGFDLEELEMLLDCYKHSVGDITMSAVSTKAGGWLLCDGTMYEKAQYPDLAAALFGLTTSDETMFAVPDLRLKSPMGVGGGLDAMATAGEMDHQLTAGEMPVHSHDMGSHTHEVGAHSHPGIPHSHNISPNPHSHQLPDVTILTKSASAVASNQRLARAGGSGTNDSEIISQPNSASQSMSLSAETVPTGNSAAFNTGAASGTSASAGGDQPHNNLHPVMGVHFFIFAGCAVSAEDCL